MSLAVAVVLEVGDLGRAVATVEAENYVLPITLMDIAEDTMEDREGRQVPAVEEPIDDVAAGLVLDVHRRCVRVVPDGVRPVVAVRAWRHDAADCTGIDVEVEPRP